MPIHWVVCRWALLVTRWGRSKVACRWTPSCFLDRTRRSIPGGRRSRAQFSINSELPRIRDEAPASPATWCGGQPRLPGMQSHAQPGLGANATRRSTATPHAPCSLCARDRRPHPPCVVVVGSEHTRASRERRCSTSHSATAGGQRGDEDAEAARAMGASRQPLRGSGGMEGTISHRVPRPPTAARSAPVVGARGPAERIPRHPPQVQATRGAAPAAVGSRLRSTRQQGQRQRQRWNELRQEHLPIRTRSMTLGAGAGSQPMPRCCVTNLDDAEPDSDYVFI